MDDDIDYDKRQRKMATEYILGPLYDPEPSQVFASRAAVPKSLPTPPESASPNRPHFFARHSRNNLREDEDLEDQNALRRFLSRSSSVNSKPQTPPPKPAHTNLTTLERKRSLHTSKPPQTRWNQGTILARANSVATSRPTIHNGAMAPHRDSGRRRGTSLTQGYFQDSYSRPLETHHDEPPSQDGGSPPRRGVSLRDPGPVDRSQAPMEKPSQKGATANGNSSLRRGGSLRERYPGDMSHRPLAMLKQEHRAADKAPHLHTHRRQQPSDIVDTLDQVAPLEDAIYHHPGPFDPVMKARNTNKRYSPVEAVKDTNMEALKATPVEFLKDSMDKHVPLQGTAIVPPGMQDRAGRTMDYQEGADLMHERDAPGGAYRRWDHIPYLDEDLKGKGEPSYTIEKEEKGKGKEINRKPIPPSKDAYEMQPRSMSGYHHKPLPSPPVGDGSNPFSDSYATTATGNVGRSNTTGRSLAASIKRRLGSLRRRPKEDERVY